MNSPARSHLPSRNLSKINTRTAAAATTTILWLAAASLYASKLLPQLPDAPRPAFDISEALLLAAASLSFLVAALRVDPSHSDHAWHAIIDPTAPPHPTVARWHILGWIGALSWAAAIAIATSTAAGAWRHPDSTNLALALTFTLIPAVECTGAAIIGPILTHVVDERETAHAARNVLLTTRAAAREHSQREA